jgi:hypothetical protein
MSVTVSLFLFGKPGQELDEGDEVTPAQLRRLAADLHDRLSWAAETVEKMTGAGWEAEMSLYDIFLHHPYLTTQAAVEQKLLDLGIDLEQLHIDEWPDEDEEECDEGEASD